MKILRKSAYFTTKISLSYHQSPITLQFVRVNTQYNHVHYNVDNSRINLMDSSTTGVSFTIITSVSKLALYKHVKEFDL